MTWFKSLASGIGKAIKNMPHVVMSLVYSVSVDMSSSGWCVGSQSRKEVGSRTEVINSCRQPEPGSNRGHRGSSFSLGKRKSTPHEDKKKVLVVVVYNKINTMRNNNVMRVDVFI